MSEVNVPDVLDEVASYLNAATPVVLGINPIAGGVVGALSGLLPIVSSLLRNGANVPESIERIRSALPELADTKARWVNRIDRIK
jgi:hypothetical protein